MPCTSRLVDFGAHAAGFGRWFVVPASSAGRLQPLGSRAVADGPRGFTGKKPDRLEVETFDTFGAMLKDCGLEACLPGCKSIKEGCRIYRSFACFDGRTYADVEAESGVMAIRVQPLDFIDEA